MKLLLEKNKGNVNNINDSNNPIKDISTILIDKNN
jgi:hypothetical protein